MTDSSVPYDLMLVDNEQHVLFIDVEEPRWASTYSDWMRRTGWWLLRRKVDSAVMLVVRVNPGDQPYYTARHVGITGSGGSNEITAYGIGKKCVDGSMVRLWIMPDGAIVGGDDVDDLGVAMVKRLGPR
jgi:hypothetical protein